MQAACQKKVGFAINQCGTLVRPLTWATNYRTTFIAEFNNAFYRDALIARIDEVLVVDGLRPARLTLLPGIHADFSAAETADLLNERSTAGFRIIEVSVV